jgi:phosphate transporter
LQYIQYGRLKRIIKRLKFLSDAKIVKNSKDDLPLQDKGSVEMSVQVPRALDENTPLLSESQREAVSPRKKLSISAKKPVKKEDEGEESDFFAVIGEEMDRINSFFVGKVAELTVILTEISDSRNNVFLTHHTGTDPLLSTRLRDVYVEVVHLISYCELNQMGFHKIIKKFDKSLNCEHLAEWASVIDTQPFTEVFQATKLMDIVTGLVSRDKLVEWERHAAQQRSKAGDELFPAVRFLGLGFSIALFAFSWIVPLGNFNDPCASRCLSLLLLTLSLWVTEAIPYYTTAIFVPVFVTIMGVLKDPADPLGMTAMTTEAAAKFVTGNIFNHTTLLLLGGYTISTAFAKCQLELRIASIVQRYFGHSPVLFILAVMFLGLFLSMWISNHTAPILCSTIILPVVRDLPTESR